MTAQADTFVRNRLPPPEHMPTLLLDRPEQQWPAQLNVVDWLFDRAKAQGHSQRPLLRSDERTLSYAQTETEVQRLSHWLVQTQGLAPGHRVLLRGPKNSREAVKHFGPAPGRRLAGWVSV